MKRLYYEILALSDICGRSALTRRNELTDKVDKLRFISSPEGFALWSDLNEM